MRIAGTVAARTPSSRPTGWRALAGTGVLTSMLAWACAESYNPHTAYASYQPPADLAQLKSGGEMSRIPIASLPISETDGYSEMLAIFHHRPNLAGYLARLTPKQESVFRALKEAYRNGPEAYARYIRGSGADAVLAGWGPPDDFYTPPCSLLADLAGRVPVVDLRPVKPMLVSELGSHDLTNAQPCNAPGVLQVGGGKDLLLPCPGPVGADRLEVLADANATFEITLLLHGRPVHQLTALPTVKAPMGLQWRCLYFPTIVFDAVRITPRAGHAVAVGRITAWSS